MSRDLHQEVGADLCRRWAAMWNGNLAIANDIITDGFVAIGDGVALISYVRTRI